MKRFDAMDWLAVVVIVIGLYVGYIATKMRHP